MSAHLDQAGFINGFSTRLGGVSDFPKDALNLAGYDDDSSENIVENRRRFLSALGAEHSIASCWQIHSDLIRIVRGSADAADGGYKMDAVISDAEGVLAGVKTADCVPILIGDPATGAFAAVHAGWRGTSLSILDKTVAKMKEVFGTDPGNLVAAIGPAAGCGDYEVGVEVIDAFRRTFDYSEELLTPTREGHSLIDLHEANKRQLVSCGVAESRISIAPYCTMRRTDLFFSYRKERPLYGKTGRLMSVVGKKKVANRE